MPATVSASEVAIVVFVVQQGLIGLLWTVLGLLRMSRAASVHWALSTFAVTGGMAMILQRDELPRLAGFWLANVLIFVGFLALRRGIRVFVHQRPGRRDDLVEALLFSLLLWVVVEHGSAAGVVALASYWLALVLVRAAWVVHRRLGDEFGARVAAGCAFPLWFIASLLSVRASAALLSPAAIGASLHQPHALNVAALLGFVVCGMLLNFGLIAMVLARMLMRLKHIGDHDGLTGLLNRRSIERALAAESARLARHGQVFSVLALDIDHFKAVNDRHGHPAGDAALRSLAQTLRRVGRITDLAARTGGEEFWLLMPHTDLRGALPVAERLLQAVRDSRVPTADGDIRFTVSVGVAQADADDKSVEALLHRLDAALYRAKHQGRDRIEVAASGSEGQAQMAGCAA